MDTPHEVVITYKSASGKSYDFNTADKMNSLLIKSLLATGQLKSGQEYDFDHQFIETEKHLQNQPTRSFWAIVQVWQSITTWLLVLKIETVTQTGASTKESFGYRVRRTAR